MRSRTGTRSLRWRERVLTSSKCRIMCTVCCALRLVSRVVSCISCCESPHDLTASPSCLIGHQCVLHLRTPPDSCPYLCRTKQDRVLMRRRGIHKHLSDLVFYSQSVTFKTFEDCKSAPFYHMSSFGEKKGLSFVLDRGMTSKVPTDVVPLSCLFPFCDVRSPLSLSHTLIQFSLTPMQTLTLTHCLSVCLSVCLLTSAM